MILQRRYNIFVVFSCLLGIFFCHLAQLIWFLQYFADRDIFCAGRVTEEDLQRVAAATGGTVQTSVNNVIDEVKIPFFVCDPLMDSRLDIEDISCLVLNASSFLSFERYLVLVRYLRKNK